MDPAAVNEFVREIDAALPVLNRYPDWHWLGKPAKAKTREGLKLLSSVAAHFGLENYFIRVQLQRLTDMVEAVSQTELVRVGAAGPDWPPAASPRQRLLERLHALHDRLP